MKHRISDYISSFKSGLSLVSLEGREYLLGKNSTSYLLFSRLCPHAKGDLFKARRESEDTLVCLNHGLCFNLQSGRLDLSELEAEVLETLDPQILDKIRLQIYIPYRDGEDWYVDLD